MSERYGNLYQKMVDILEKLDPEELNRRSERRSAIDELSPGRLASMWVDVDATIPWRDDRLNIEEVVRQHIGAIEAWLDTLGCGSPKEIGDRLP
jgi:hypothetical protein